MKIARSKNLGPLRLRNRDAEIWRPLMPKNTKKKADDLLARLVSTAEKDVLGGLISELAGVRPERC
jgi:hypothetical protein